MVSLPKAIRVLVPLGCSVAETCTEAGLGTWAGAVKVAAEEAPAAMVPKVALPPDTPFADQVAPSGPGSAVKQLLSLYGTSDTVSLASSATGLHSLMARS